MNASSIRSPSQSTLDQIADVLQRRVVSCGPIFAFDLERTLLVFVHVVDGQIEHWRVEHCPDAETYRLRVRGFLEAALDVAADLGSAMTAAAQHTKH